ncbi:phage terminase large subunit [Sphingomonas sp.]|uniref:phage terminase large subunit n=1 Tax=Sphingomonas sp. TaxID=28214 RepID=UPI0025E5E9F5|nr:phage terminase large subunit [Sphingomonas sp.]
MRHDFCAFLRKAFPAIRGGAPLSWNWHLDAIAYELGRMASGQSRNLLVTMPPRNLKSITISVAWVAWMLGRDPRLNFVCVSYSNELSAKMARDCISLIQSDWYRALFPATNLSPKRSATWDFETTVGGGRLATSITGTLTGRGGSIIIVDDPIKPDEAHSETTRNSVNQWFRSTLSSRLDDKERGGTIVVMQRLHQDDLAGMLMEAGGWVELSLPAIAQEDQSIPLPGGRIRHRKAGELLHPERESQAVLDQLRLTMGSFDFSAQYLQQPIPATGNLIKSEWLKYFAGGFDPRGEPGQIVQSWDTASKDGTFSDYSACVTAHLQRGTIKLLDVFRERLAFPALKSACIRLARKHNASVLLIEDAASGTQLLQTLRSECPSGVPRPIGRKPEADKVSRVAGVSAQVESGQLWLPVDAPWLASFQAELLGFPNARYDDQVDALSQLLSWSRKAFPRRVRAVAPPIILRSPDPCDYFS